MSIEPLIDRGDRNVGSKWLEHSNETMIVSGNIKSSSLIPKASHLNDITRSAYDIDTVIRKSGVVDALNEAAARGLNELDYYYYGFGPLMNGSTTRMLFIWILRNAGYCVRDIEPGYMKISWGVKGGLFV